MNHGIHPEMAEVTRLTRAGHLADATALIQRLLRGGSPDTEPAPARADRHITIDLVPDSVEVNEPEVRRPQNEAWRPQNYGKTTGFRAPGADMPAGAKLWAPAPAALPETLPPGASFTGKSFTSQAGTRAYKLYVPSGHASGETRPLVVMLHGCTQSPDDFAAGTRMNVFAEKHGCFVAYPAQPASANAQKCWNWFDPNHQRRDSGEPALIAGITRQIMRDHRVDPHRIYIAGLSAGGAAAAVMAATYNDLYAAAGIHSGLACGAATDLPSAFTAMRQGGGTRSRAKGARIVPTIVFHGDRDTTVHPCNGDDVIAQATAAAMKLRTTVQRGQVPGGHAYSCTVHAAGSGEVLCEQWTIHGGGHAWAGGSPNGSYTDPRGPDATAEMLRFFLQHRRGGM